MYLDIKNSAIINIERKKVASMGNNLMIYEDKGGITKVSVKFIYEDIWLTQNQIAEIYKTTQKNIRLHIKSIYCNKELLESSTYKKFLLVQK